MKRALWLFGLGPFLAAACGGSTGGGTNAVGGGTAGANGGHAGAGEAGQSGAAGSGGAGKGVGGGQAGQSGSAGAGGKATGGSAGQAGAGGGGRGGGQGGVQGGSSGSAGSGTAGSPGSGGAVTAPDADLLAYDGFSYPAGDHTGGDDTLGGGKGWAKAWDYGENDASFSTSSANPLSFPGLRTEGGYIIHKNAESGRELDVRGVFAAYAINLGQDDADVGADGTTLWLSALLRSDVANPSQPLFFTTSVDAFGFHFYGSESIWAVGVDPGVSHEWTLFMGGYPYMGNQSPPTAHGTGKSIVSGAAAFLVVRFDFKAGNDQISLWVNPTPGVADPGTADAAAPTKSNLQFKSFGWSAETELASLDEVRVGKSYAAVAPAP